MSQQPEELVKCPKCNSMQITTEIVRNKMIWRLPEGQLKTYKMIMICAACGHRWQAEYKKVAIDELIMIGMLGVAGLYAFITSNVGVFIIPVVICLGYLWIKVIANYIFKK